MFTSICKMDIKFFPFDEQHCELEFGSWSYDSSKIDIEIDQNETKIHREVYQENNEWNVVSLKGRNRSVSKLLNVSLIYIYLLLRQIAL